MSQRPDDFYADLGRFGASDELRPVYERLDADARAWSATVGDEMALVAFARALPRRSREETMRMQSQPRRPEWDATQRLPYSNPDYQPQQRPSRLRTWVAVIAATLVVALLGGSFYIAAERHATAEQLARRPRRPPRRRTTTPLPTATATVTATAIYDIDRRTVQAACQTDRSSGSTISIRSVTSTWRST